MGKMLITVSQFCLINRQKSKDITINMVLNE